MNGRKTTDIKMSKIAKKQAIEDYAVFCSICFFIRNLAQGLVLKVSYFLATF